MSIALQTTSSYSQNWRLNSLRFTFFSDTPLTVSGSTLFEEFFGLTPDAETHRKAEFLSGFTTEKGNDDVKKNVIETLFELSREIPEKGDKS